MMFVSLVILSTIVNCIKSEYAVHKIEDQLVNCSYDAEWSRTKEYKTEKISSSEAYTIDQNNTLIISNGDSNDSLFDCTCKKAGSKTSYYPITDVEIEGDNNTHISIAAYSSCNTVVKCILLTCSLNHNITWEWYFNDVLINDTERFKITTFADNTTLNIWQISESGAYRCLAKNSFDQHSKTTYLKVKSFYDSILPLLLAVIQVTILTSVVFMFERMQKKRPTRRF